MQKFYLFLLMWISGISVLAQTPVHFEDVILPASGVWNGADGSGYFRSGGMTFHNSYDNEWKSWSGFACSNHKDTTTAGYANQYSAAAGGGYGGSGNFAVAYDFSNVKITPAQPTRFSGMYLTNSTYAYLTMRDGNSWAKKFGGATGNDPDYFRVNIIGIGTGGDTTGTVVFYLADYRDQDPRKDYLVKEWTWVPLDVLGEVAMLRFALESSDTGSYGMNTPGYFCMDNINDRALPAATLSGGVLTEVYPNPFTTSFFISQLHGPMELVGEVSLTDATGRSWPVELHPEGTRIRVTPSAQMPSGMAILRFQTKSNHPTFKIFRSGKP
jgi:hypothetical protein